MSQKRLKINFIGNFSRGYVGEEADEIHLVQELVDLGHDVNVVPRDVWKAFVNGDEPQDDWNLPVKADVNIMCKWNHFDHQKYVYELSKVSNAPVMYWVWDYMDYGHEGFHYKTAYAADLLLTNDGLGRVPEEIDWHYFPFDVSSKEFTRQYERKSIDVAFFGSYLQQGDRVKWLTEINKTHPVVVYSWNPEEWIKAGFEAYPAVYGDEFAKTVAKTKVILGFNVNDETWGYWSNRVGKVMTVGGFLLYRYVKGMELFMRDGAEYFSSIDEARKKIDFYLQNEHERETIAQRGYEIGKDRFTSLARIKELVILIKRYLAGGLI